MIRRTLRIGLRLALLAGIGVGLFKLVKGRRSAEYGSPSPDWAPLPAQEVPNPNLPKPVPEPDLVTPTVLEEIVEKRKRLGTDEAPPVTTSPATTTGAPASAENGAGTVKRATPAKRAPRKAAAAPAPSPAQAAAATDTAAAPAAKKAAPARKAPATAKKAAPAKGAGATATGPAAKKAPAKKAPGPRQP